MGWFRSDPGESAYPLERTFDRKLGESFRGEVYTWDVDNTYIRTDFTSLRSMLSLPFELAIDKQPFPGVPELLQEVRKGPGPETRETPLLFVSASPRQMRSVLEKRMLLDGIEQDGFTLRDWGPLIRGGRFRKLKDPVGYKLAALLSNRLELPLGAREILFGDDTERDALVYSLYGDIVAGRLRGIPLRDTLNQLAPDDAEFLLGLASQCPVVDSVVAILIHLARGRGPAAFEDYSTSLFPFENYFQAALTLRGLDQISEPGLARVSKAVAEAGVDLQESIWDANRRGLIAGEAFDAASAALDLRKPLPAGTATSAEASSRPEGGFLTPARYRNAPDPNSKPPTEPST